MTLFSTYRSYFRKKVIREDGVRGTDISLTTELSKFVLPAAALCLLASATDEPFHTGLLVIAVLIVAVGLILLTTWFLQVIGRGGDKVYNQFTRKILSREYREDDR